MSPDRIKWLGKVGLRLLGVSLVLLHGQLLWQRWVDGSLVDLGVIAQWSASGLLVAALVSLRRRHGSIFHGRQAAVLWILVALLHALAGVPVAQMLAAPAPWMAVPLGLVAVGGLLWGLGRRYDGTALAAALRAAPATAVFVLLSGFAALPGARGPPC